MYTLKEINPARLNNPDANEKTLFLDEADSKLKTKDSTGTIEELSVEGGASTGPLVYKATVTQTGTNAPVAVIITNTLSGTPVWSYEEFSEYRLTLVGAFTENKTFFTLYNGRTTGAPLSIEWISEDVIRVAVDGVEYGSSFPFHISIEVYP